MGQGGISGVRYLDYIDIYNVSPTHQLTHYWANPQTNWAYLSEVYAKDAKTGCAVIREGNNIDLYYVNIHHQLVHIWIGMERGWVPVSQVVSDGINWSTPAAIRFRDNIDIYCVRNDGAIIHIWRNPSTHWNNMSEVIFQGKACPSALTAVRTSEWSLDLFFVSGRKIYHMNNGVHLKWRADKMGIYSKGENRTGTQQITNAQDVGDQMSAIRCLNHIDVYYCYGQKVYHTYSGSNNNFEWTVPQAISEPSENEGNLVAVRPYQKAIDVYYVSKGQLKNLYIGEGTGGNWTHYQSGSNGLTKKPILRWEQIKHQCTLLAQGWNGMVYDWKKGKDHYWQGLIIKIYKKPNPKALIHEIEMLDLLQPMYPELCKFQVTKNNRLVGLTMKKYSQGEKIEKLYFNEKNIFATNPDTRVMMIKQLRREILKLQALEVCHADIHLDNFLVRQDNFLTPDCSIFLIDFGNSLKFNGNSYTNSQLTGFQWAIPPQVKSGYYNPKGVNAYQLGKVSLQILLKKSFESTRYGRLESTETQIKNLLEQGYNESVQLYIRSLLQTDIDKRVAALNKDPQIDFSTIRIPNKLPKKRPKTLTELILQQCHTVNDFRKIFGRELYELIPPIWQKDKYQWYMAMQNTDGRYILWGSCGVKLSDNILVTLNAEVALACTQILSGKCRFSKVDLTVLKLAIAGKTGAYNGIQAYAALFEGELGVFDARLAIGVSTGMGIQDDSWSMRLFGCGFKFGRKIGFQLFGSYFYIDLKRFLPQVLYNAISNCITFAIQFFLPPLALLLQVLKLPLNISRDGRQIGVAIMNLTKFTWKLDHLHLVDGRTYDGTQPKVQIKPGDNSIFKVCKDVGFYGVEGYVSYFIQQISQHIIFLFSNPYGFMVQWKWNNRVACQLIDSSRWRQLGGKQSIFDEVWHRRLYSDRWNEYGQHYTPKHIQTKKTFKKVFYIQGQASSKAIFYVTHDYMNNLVDWDKLKRLE